MPAAADPAPRLLFQRLGEKWTIPLLGALYEHAHRYSEIKKRFPLTSKVLSRTLLALQQDHLVTRVESPVVRRSVTYELTPAGRRLVEFVRSFDNDFAPAEGQVPRFARTPAPPPQVLPDPGAHHPLNPVDTDLSFRFVTVATPDLTGYSERLAHVLGVTLATAHEIPIIMPAGGDATLRISWFRLQSFSVALAQPLDTRLPHAAFLARSGPGIHHLGFNTSANLDAIVPALRQMGGRWTVGSRGAGYAQLDFREQLGAAIGISSTFDRDAAVRGPGGTPAPGGADLLSRHRVTNVGVIVRSIEETARAYTEIFGLGISPIRAVDLALPGVAIVSHGAARVAYLRLKGVAIKLIEPLSDGPLAEVLAQYGNRAHHLGFDVGRAFAMVLSRLEGLGGRIMLGRRDLGYVLVDFTESIGLVLELTGTPVHP